MSSPFFRSPLARGLILTLAVTSLAGYVVNVSCSRPAPSTTPAVAPYMPDAATRDASAASAQQGAPVESPAGLMEQPARPRLYGRGTKSGFAIHGPRTQAQETAPANAAPNQAPNQAPNKDLKKPPPRFYGPATKSDIPLARDRAKQDALRSNPLQLFYPQPQPLSQ
jgi:hypothetical protein